MVLHPFDLGFTKCVEAGLPKTGNNFHHSNYKISGQKPTYFFAFPFIGSSISENSKLDEDSHTRRGTEVAEISTQVL